MELELVDRESRELRSGATQVLERMGRGHDRGDHPRAKHELMESTVEVLTGICDTVDEARRDLAATIEEVRAAAEPLGLELICSGTHPFTDWATQEISPDPRYEKLVDEMQWLARRLQIFGIHFHVGVRAPDKAIPMVNALSFYIPHLLALSASSPYWVGRDTGLASCRSKVFEALPTAGPPYQLSGWDEFEAFMSTLIAAKTIETIREVWWDVRPHPEFGTVELRVCDGIPTISEVAAVAALCQCLVEHLDGVIDRDGGLRTPRRWIVSENKWRAARYGLEADIIVDDTGQLLPLRQALAELVEQLAPIAERLSCSEPLGDVLGILARGPSYVRQREVVAAGGSLSDVVDNLVGELKADAPAPAPAPGA